MNGAFASDNPESWLDEHGDVMFRYAIMRVRDNAIAEDLVQEAFVSALASQSFNGKSTRRTWLIGILRHKIIDHLRAKSRSPKQQAVDLDQAPPPRSEAVLRWPSDPAEIFEQKEFWKVFECCTGKLPEPLADAYYLREIARLSTAEICQELGITPNSLSIRIYRARVALRECLDRNWFHGRQQND